MVSNPQFLLQSVVSRLTSTPLLKSKPQQQHWEFRRLLHNCGVSATQHSHQFLKVGTSAIQKGKKKSGFLPRVSIRSRRQMGSFAKAFLMQGSGENVKIMQNKWTTPKASALLSRLQASQNNIINPLKGVLISEVQQQQPLPTHTLHSLLEDGTVPPAHTCLQNLRNPIE